MPTWWIDCQAGPELKKTRSPGSRPRWATAAERVTSMVRVAQYWSAATRGRAIPCSRYARHTNPLQSYRCGPSAPHWYGLPNWESANFTAAIAASPARNPLTGCRAG